MDSLRDLAGRLDDATETLAECARRLPYVGAAGDALHVDGPGRPGEIGRALRRQWGMLLDDRIRELTGTVERLTDTAAALRTAAQRYADTDDAAEQRFRPVIAGIAHLTGDDVGAARTGDHGGAGWAGAGGGRGAGGEG
ncbi:type VII secretion target [Plantactinospora sonchi]|uniref:Type VII secretion target n=1 Tax=Plantactinospora sonchi TaxID=1544735 RepID=A0ABU7RXN7_9ACTN